MTVPTSVKELLETQNVHYSVSLPDDFDACAVPQLTPRLHEQCLRQMGAARSLILQDDEGRVQVIAPANCLLDLSAANRCFGRQLRAISSVDLATFFEKHQLASVPALPKLAGLPTLVDKRLLEQPRVLLDSGADELLEVSQEDFAALVADAEVGDICVPLELLEQKFRQSCDDEADITAAVKNFTGKRVRQRLEETLELPPLSQTAQRIIKLRVDPNADISDLANIVETDPSLAAQVVSWASSPYYSAPGKIKSIHDAIVRVLGFDMVLNLALGLALGRTMSMPKDGPHGAAPYWQQAVYTAATVEGLVTAIPRESRPGFGMAYLSGLLHNFGWLVLAEVFPPQFATICRLLEANTHVPPQLVEYHVLGISREQIAGWLMQLWNMPEEVVVALRYQNEVEQERPHVEYARLIFIAQRLLQQQGIGQGPRLEIPDSLFRQLSLDSEAALQTVDTILSSSGDLDSIVHQLAL